jgi:defect-in-organelle-trafficking protein DotC
MSNSSHFLLACALAAACSVAWASASGSQEPPSLDALLATQPASPERADIPAIRFNAIRETGLTYGSQAGLARRSYENMKRLERQAAQLDVVYNFQALMLEGNVVPPVLTETNDVYDQSSDDMLRVIGKVYRIESQARFVYTTPTWRSYVMNSYSFDGNVVAAVAPKSANEERVWKDAVAEGFKLGAEQADEILKANFAVLQRDFKGMVLYHKLLDQGMVTRPFVASNRSGVRRAEDGSMHIGEVFLRITASPEFVTETEQWKKGHRSQTAERLRALADPEEAQRRLDAAVRAGRIKDHGR